MNKTSFLSETKSLAFESIGLAFRSNFEFNFLIFSGSPDNAIFTLIFLLNFSRAGTITLLLSSKSRADVQIKTSFSEFSINSLIFHSTLERPFNEPVISFDFIGDIPEL